MKATATFRDAEALATFANLDPENADAVAYFRNNYPNFAPVEWWDYKYNEYSLCSTLTEAELEKDPSTWEDTKPAGVLEEAPVFMWQVTQDEIQRLWKNHFQFESVFWLTALLKHVFVAPPDLIWNQDHLYLPDYMFQELLADKTYSFHTAVLYLNDHPKQAKICKECGKYFVTAHGKRAFCLYPDERGETCSQKQIAKQHLEWWRNHGEKQRKAKQKQKQKQRQKRTR